MKASEYLKSMSLKEREIFAKKIETTLGYLNLVAGGHRQMGPQLAQRFVRETNGEVTLAEARPDIWGNEDAA